MKALVAGLLAGLLAILPARAEEASACSTPSYLLTTDSTLPKVATAIKTARKLDILVLGSGSSALAGPDGVSASYPARLEASLREKLAGVNVTVHTDLRPKKTAAEMADGLGGMIAKLPVDQKPNLVIWQTGTVDAIRSVDPDDFRAVLVTGVSTLQQAGTDVLLMNLQYNPRMETMLSVTPYNDTIRVVGQEREVPVYDRFSIMRHWSDAGDFDLFGPVHGYGMAKKVHDCIGRSLSVLITEASRINPAETGTQR